MRKKVRFTSGDAECAAWFYPGSTGACVIMAGGFGVTKEPGTDAFAARFNDAGFGVLAFDYRRIGESTGRPRQVAGVRDSLADWQAAIDFAPTLPGVDPTRIAVWGFSASGGHIFRAAAANPQLAAAIAQTPNADGVASSPSISRHQTPLAQLRFLARAVADVVGRRLGRPPRLVPLVGQPGTVAMLTTPDALDGYGALDPDNRYRSWQREMAAGSALRLVFYRPGRVASRIRVPLLVVVADDDRSAPAAPAVTAAGLAPHGELVRVPGGHYAPFLDAHAKVVSEEVAFLHRHVAAPVKAST